MCISTPGSQCATSQSRSRRLIASNAWCVSSRFRVDTSPSIARNDRTRAARTAKSTGEHRRAASALPQVTSRPGHAGGRGVLYMPETSPGLSGAACVAAAGERRLTHALGGWPPTLFALNDARPRIEREIGWPEVTSGPSVIPATKFHIPSVRAGIVPREGLVDLLVRGRQQKLTLLDAPAGFGKTTLLAEWCASPLEEGRSEEHTSELQSRLHLVCRLLLEKKNEISADHHISLVKARNHDRLSQRFPHLTLTHPHLPLAHHHHRHLTEANHHVLHTLCIPYC